MLRMKAVRPAILKSGRSFVPPAPPPPSRFSTYGAEGRQDIFRGNSFVRTQTVPSDREQQLLGNTDDLDDLEGTMLQLKVCETQSAAPTIERVPGVGGNTVGVTLDVLPVAPYDKYAEVLDAIRRAIFTLCARKANSGRQTAMSNPNPVNVPIAAVSLGHVMAGLSLDVRKLLRHPLFSGLELTMRNCPIWFEISNDALQVRLTQMAHQGGTAMTPATEVPVPHEVQRQAEFDSRLRSEAAAFRERAERESQAQQSSTQQTGRSRCLVRGDGDAFRPEAFAPRGEQPAPEAFKPRSTQAAPDTFRRRSEQPTADSFKPRSEQLAPEAFKPRNTQAAPDSFRRRSEQPTADSFKPRSEQPTADSVKPRSEQPTADSFKPRSEQPAPEAFKPRSSQAAPDAFRRRSEQPTPDAFKPRSEQPAPAPEAFKPRSEQTASNIEGLSGVSAKDTPSRVQEEPVERKPLVVKLSKSPHANKRGSESIIFDRFLLSVGRPDPMLANSPDSIHNGGTIKRLMSRDGKYVGTVDMRTPPLTQEGVDGIPLMKAEAFLGGCIVPDPRRFPRAPPPSIFPPTVPFHRMPELKAFDDVYGMYSRLLPSEVAHAMFEFVPTYFVEVRNILKNMPPPAFNAIFTQERRTSDGRLFVSTTFFRKYPMLFDLHIAKGDFSTVRINYEANPALRKHPRFGMADSFMRKYNLERDGSVSPLGVIESAAVDSVQADGPATSNEKARAMDTLGTHRDSKLGLQIFNILLKHLPTANGTEGFVSLVRWINSFPPEDLAVLNEVPQERVIRIILKYCRVFQLSDGGHDPNLFLAYSERSDAPGPAKGADQPLMEDELDELHSLRHAAFDDLVDDVEAEAETAAVADTEAGVTEAPTIASPPVEPVTNDEHPPEASASEDAGVPPSAAMPRGAMLAVDLDESLTPEERTRVSAFQSSLAEDMIGVDDILLGGGGSEMMDRGTGAVEYSNQELAESIAEDTRELSGQRSPQDEGPVLASGMDALLIRALPPSLSPRCLSDLGFDTSPEPDLIEAIMGYVPAHSSAAGSASLRSRGAAATAKADPRIIPEAPQLAKGTVLGAMWRWVPIEKIYRALSTAQRRRLRDYRGLPNFLRLHGRLVEVSADSRYVISHSPDELPPFIPTTTLFAFEERVHIGRDGVMHQSAIGEEAMKTFDRVLGRAQVPTSRSQLQLLDPRSPLLDNAGLAEEISDFLPDHPVAFRVLMLRLPPLIRAAMPIHTMRFFMNSQQMSVFNQKGTFYIMKKSLGEVQGLELSDAVATRDEALQQVRDLIPDSGSTTTRIWVRLGFGARNFIRTSFGDLMNFIESFPKHFYAERTELGERRNVMLIHLVDKIEERRSSAEQPPPS